MDSPVHAISYVLKSREHCQKHELQKGQRHTNAGCWMKKSTMGKECRWPLEAQQPGNYSLEPPCSPINTLILAQRNSCLVFNLYAFKIICTISVTIKNYTEMLTNNRMVLGGNKLFCYSQYCPGHSRNTWIRETQTSCW